MKKRGVKTALLGGILVALLFAMQQIVLWYASLELSPIAANPPTIPVTQGVTKADDDTPGRPLQTNTPSTTPSAETARSASPKSARIEEPETTYVTIDNKTYPLRTYKMLLTPNDPYGSQWWMTNASVTTMWDTPRGATATTLAVIDTGFGLQHEEFIGRWATNNGESGSAAAESPSQLNCTDRSLAVSKSCNLIDDNLDGIVDNEVGTSSEQNPSRLNCTAQARPLQKDCNRIDDDGNGFVDDVTGWDFAHADNSAQAGEVNPFGDGVSHGSMVAGIAAANGNNAKGTAGVDWGTKILPIQALDDDGIGNTVSVGKAIRYAADRGADVINISLGSTYADEYVRESIAYAMARGVLIVASSGNDGCNCLSYPAAYPEVVAVGALSTTGSPASYSSWGQNLDIMAPGSLITAPSWSAANGTSAYANGSGTSFAAPVVSGIATRVLSHHTTIHPAQLLAAITETSNRLSLPATSVRSDSLGFGSVSAKAATDRATTATAFTQPYAFSGISSGSTLNPASPLEPLGTFTVMPCDATKARTPIFELIKGSHRFYTVSQVESYTAESLGYVATIFAYSCLTQPLDTLQNVRLLNTSAEFRNVFSAH